MATFDKFAWYYDNLCFRLITWRFYRPVLQALAPHLGVSGTALEVGCGTGNFLLALRSRFPTVELHGIDPSVEMLARARLKFPGADLRQAGGEALPYENNSFDLVAIIHALHHIPEQAAALREAQRVLKPGGLLVVLDPARDNLFWRQVLRGAKRWTAMERDSKFFYVDELTQLLKQSGFAIISSDRRIGSIVVVANK